MPTVKKGIVNGHSILIKNINGWKHKNVWKDFKYGEQDDSHCFLSYCDLKFMAILNFVCEIILKIWTMFTLLEEYLRDM